MTTRLFDSDADEALFDRAESAWQQGHWRQAVDLFLELLQRRLPFLPPLTLGDKLTIERMADASVLCGVSEAATHFLSALVLAGTNAGERFVADYHRLKRADVLLDEGRYPEAMEVLHDLESTIGSLQDVPTERSSLDAWEQRCSWKDRRDPDRGLFFTRLYLVMGKWLAGNGQYQHAIELLIRGAELAQSPASSLVCRARIPLHLTLATACLEKGELDQAEQTLLTIAPEIQSHEHPGWYVQRLELSGQLHLLRGEHGPALACFQQVTDVCAQNNFAQAAVNAALNQAQILISLNQVITAEDVLEEAAEIALQIEDQSGLARITWLSRLSEARGESPFAHTAPSVKELWQGSEGVPEIPEQAPRSRASPLDLPQPADYLAFFDDRALGVTWALADGNVQLADDLLDEMRTTFASADSRLIQLRLHALAGMVCYAACDYSSCARIFEEVCPELKQMGLRRELWQALRFREWCALRLKAPPAEATELNREALQLLDEMAETLPPEQRAIWWLNKWTDEERYLAGVILELDREKERMEQAPWWKRWRLRWRLYSQVNDLLKRLDQHRGRQGGPFRTSQLSQDGLTVWQRLWRPRWRSTTLVFLVLADFTFVVSVSWMSLDFRVVPLTRLRARELTARWHRSVAQADPADGDKESLQALAEQLELSEILDQLPQRARQLTLVADDCLHGAPFAAMLYRGEPLISKYRLHVGFDSSEMTRPPRLQKFDHGLVLAVPNGVPDLGISPLEEVVEEASQVQHWMQQKKSTVEVLMGTDATKPDALSGFAQAEVVHVACHGIFSPDSPDQTGLVLIPTAEGIEIVSLLDLADLDLSQLQHLTLSCCWGADNYVLPGRRIVSTAEITWRAGAKSILACLWPIHDTIGRLFVTAFYEHAEKYPLDEALRQTQLDCLNRRLRGVSGEDTADPFFWAGYRLHG